MCDVAIKRATALAPPPTRDERTFLIRATAVAGRCRRRREMCGTTVAEDNDEMHLRLRGWSASIVPS